jgi:pimeloyl-ACP methyl ester carboxylesterase
MPTTQRAGSTIHYRVEGKGPDALLLLHAFPLNAGMWDDQVPALIPRWKVVAPDYPGLGRTPPRAGPSTIEALAQDALAVLDQERVRRAVVVGLSMGGYVAFEVLRRRPDAVSALVLCDTRAGADTPEGAAGRETFAQRALERGLGWVADEMLPKLLSPAAPPAVQARVRGLIAEGTPEGVAAAQRGMARRPDSHPILAGIGCPTCVLVGASDTLTPPEESRRIAAAVPGARLVEIPDAGHLSNLEAPAAFGRELRGFLEGLRG